MARQNNPDHGRQQGAGEQPDDGLHQPDQNGDQAREPNPNRDPTQNRPSGRGRQSGGRQDPQPQG
jgi:hypothetical protein